MNETLRPAALPARVAHALREWTLRHGFVTLRVCIGLVYLWFGALKFDPVVTHEDSYLPGLTMDALTFGLVPSADGVRILAVWECVIGACLIFGIFMRTAMLLMAAHLLVMLVPAVVSPRKLWHTFPYGLTLKGQYIVKNLVFIGAAVALASRLPSSRGRKSAFADGWFARHQALILRIGLGVVYFWFGALKYFENVSPAEQLAGATIERLTFGLMPPEIGLPVLATWEVLIGIGLFVGFFPRVLVGLIVLHLIGTFTPFFFFPDACWYDVPFVLTLEGKYIVRNLVLFSAAMVLGTHASQRSWSEALPTGAAARPSSADAPAVAASREPPA